MDTRVLGTSRLVVRPKTSTDAGPLHAVYGDPIVMRFLGGPFSSLARTRQFLARHIEHQDFYGFSMWSLVENATSEVIGDVGFLRFEIGWHLRRASWGKGFGTEAARACLAYGFDHLGFRTVSAFTETANAASLRVIERLDMRLVRDAADDNTPWREYQASVGRGGEV
jgi:[ribosomal protein S5]-alanine N-acetyltransferase